MLKETVGAWFVLKTSSWLTKYSVGIELKYWKKYSIIKRTSSVNQWKVFTELSFSYLVSQQHLSWVKPRQAQKQTLDTPLRQDCCHMGLWRYCTCMWQALTQLLSSPKKSLKLDTWGGRVIRSLNAVNAYILQILPPSKSLLESMTLLSLQE